MPPDESRVDHRLEIVRRRAHDFNFNLYVQVASLLASATLALAAVELVQILESDDDIALRCSLWLATVLGVFGIFGRAIHDNMFQTARVRLGVWFYMLMGLSQLAMLATLQPQANSQLSWRWWFPASLLYMLSTAALVRHIGRHVRASDFPAALAAFAERFVRRTTTDDIRLVAANVVIICVATTYVFAASADSLLLKPLVTLFGAVLSVLGAMLLYQDIQLFEIGWDALERGDPSSEAQDREDSSPVQSP